MTTPIDQNRTSQKKSIEKQKRINVHKRIASHLERAAKNHNDAAKHYEDNDADGAANSAMIAHKHLTQANEIAKIESDKDALSRRVEAVKDKLENKK